LHLLLLSTPPFLSDILLFMVYFNGVSSFSRFSCFSMYYFLLHYFCSIAISFKISTSFTGNLKLLGAEGMKGNTNEVFFFFVLMIVICFDNPIYLELIL